MHRVRAPRVLIVADEHALLRLLSRLLQQDGYSVRAIDPAEADFFALGQEDPPYDLVVIDSFLPDLARMRPPSRSGRCFPGPSCCTWTTSRTAPSVSIVCWIGCTKWPEPPIGGRAEASPAWK
jgi:hypothetical protein